MKTYAPAIALVLLWLAACKPVSVTSDAAPTASSAVSDCPLPLHPGYCTRGCRTYGQRVINQHATRVRKPGEVEFGTCGELSVFHERDLSAHDAGITEFYDDAGTLVAAKDDRLDASCVTFGLIPQCALSLHVVPQPDVATKVLTAAKAIDSQALDAHMMWLKPRIRSCYAQVLVDSPTVSGKVLIGFDVEADGTVTSPKSLSGTTLKVDSLVHCALNAMTIGTLPPLTGGKKAAGTAEVTLTPGERTAVDEDAGSD